MEPNSRTNFRTAFHEINMVVPVDSSALIEGTMGVGKRGIAPAIHEPSSRLRSPLVAVNCEATADTRFEGIVGSSEFLLHVLRQLARVAPTECTVLVTGESGTGKVSGALLMTPIGLPEPRSQAVHPSQSYGVVNGVAKARDPAAITRPSNEAVSEEAIRDELCRILHSAIFIQ